MKKKSFLKRLSDYEGVITFVSFVAGVLIYAFANFATIKYVDEKLSETNSSLAEIKETLKHIDNRLWQLKTKDEYGIPFAIDPGEVD